MHGDLRLYPRAPLRPRKTDETHLRLIYNYAQLSIHPIKS